MITWSQHRLHKIAETNGRKSSRSLTHLAFFTGWPNIINAAAIAGDVFQ
jgi:hypothetical protein